MNFDIYPKKSMLLVALAGLFFSSFSYASNPHCKNCNTPPGVGGGPEHTQEGSDNTGNDNERALYVQNNSDQTVFMGPLHGHGNWDTFSNRRIYAEDDICLKYVPIQGINLAPHSSFILTEPMPSSFWMDDHFGHYCRFSFTTNKGTISVKYAQAGFWGIDGAYGIEGENTTDLDFTTDKGILIIY